MSCSSAGYRCLPLWSLSVNGAQCGVGPSGSDSGGATGAMSDTSAPGWPPIMNRLRPLTYGYLRVPREADDTTIRHLEHTLTDYADTHGFDFAAFFHEFDTGSYAAFAELIVELQRAEAHTVIVPSMRHLSPNPLLRSCLLNQLERDGKAEVLDTGVPGDG